MKEFICVKSLIFFSISFCEMNTNSLLHLIIKIIIVLKKYRQDAASNIKIHVAVLCNEESCSSRQVKETIQFP